MIRDSTIFSLLFEVNFSLSLQKLNCFPLLLRIYERFHSMFYFRKFFETKELSDQYKSLKDIQSI